MRQSIASLLDSASTIVDAEIASRDRDLGQRLREKKQLMAADGRIGYGPDWVVMLEMYEAELAPRADIVRNAYLNALKAAKDTPTNDEASGILLIADARSKAAYDALIAVATSFFAERPGWYIPRLTERAAEALTESLHRLRLEITNLQTKARQEMPSKKFQIILAVLGFVFALSLAALTNFFTTRAREKEQLLSRRNEIITELFPKLEEFRKPLDPVTKASEAADETTYRRELDDALNETTRAVQGLSNGYDLIRTKVALNFDSTLVQSIDSIGKDAESSRLELQKMLAEGRYFAQRGKDPGEALGAFQDLNARVTRIERALLSQR